MKCPHCDESISILSREMNRFGRKKSCPHCTNPVRLAVNFKVAAMLFFPAVVVALVLDAVFESVGLSGALSLGLVGGMYVLLSFGLKAA